MATAKKPTESAEISIMRIVTGRLEVCILGTSPLICNRISNKTTKTLLAPGGKKNDAEKASTLKHDPLQEFRDSPYLIENPRSPALLGALPTWFKQGMGTAALDMPGTKRTQIGRLITVDWDRIPLFGIPKLFMAVTRSADINKTPDVRTRSILPEWACKVAITYVKPILREQAVANLLSAAGFLAGCGDWRQEKGSGSYGSYKLVGDDDPDYQRIVKTMGRKAQVAAMQNPEPYDDETSELLAWFDVEVKNRGFSPTSRDDIMDLDGEVPAKPAYPPTSAATKRGPAANGATQ